MRFLFFAFLVQKYDLSLYYLTLPFFLLQLLFQTLLLTFLKLNAFDETLFNLFMPTFDFL